MASKKSRKTKVQTVAPKTSPEPPPPESNLPEAQFSDSLSPVMGCPPGVLDRSRIELYGGLVLGVLLQAIPMSAFTRSLFFLVVLAAFIDVTWRSVWMHYRPTGVKAAWTASIFAVYLALVTVMFSRENETFKLAVLAVLKSNGFRHFLTFLAGGVATILASKGLDHVSAYIRARRAEKEIVRERFQATQKGWLDYRVESEESSERLHSATARFLIPLGRISKAIVIANWFLRRNLTVGGAHTWAYLVATVINRASATMELCIDDLRSAADSFTESTSGHLRVCRQNYGKLAGAHEYFAQQFKEVRDAGDILRSLPSKVAQFKGFSQDLDAAVNRQSVCLRSYSEILQNLEGHCARMVKLSETRRDQALIKPLQKPIKRLTAILKKLAKMSDEDVADDTIALVPQERDPDRRQ